jgi:hypothetical protein
MARGPGAALEDVYEPEPEAVFRRLEELGVPYEAVTEPVRIGYLRGDFTTAAHPPTYPGTVVWGEITGEFRGRMALVGWGFDNTDNIPRCVSPDGRVVIVPVRGNDMTGIRNQHEKLSTRRRRGTAAVRIIRENTQYVLQLDDTPMSSNLTAALDGTWFLLYTRDGDTVRLELSYAKAVDHSGTLLKWAERLILPDIDLMGPPPTDDRGRGDESLDNDVDVPVSRRVS